MSKVRLSFITNSSSSSFVLGFKNNLTREEIEKVLMTKEDRIRESIEWRDNYTVEDALNETVDKIIRYKKYGLNFGDWVVIGGRSSNEDGVAESVFYEIGDIDTENFKFKDVGY